MSDTVTPILDVSESQRILADEDHKRTLSAGQSSDDLVDRVQHDAVALGIRLAQLRSQDEILGHIKEAITADTDITIRNSAGILSRLDDLALQATSNTLSADQREAIRIESDSLKAALDRLANAAGAGAAAPPPAAAKAATQETDALLKTSNLSGNLILGHTDASVHAQANQDAAEALKLLDND